MKLLFNEVPNTYDPKILENYLNEVKDSFAVKSHCSINDFGYVPKVFVDVKRIVKLNSGNSL